MAATKPLRADAQRNRDRVLTAARTAFAQPGSAPTLEGIARDAGVGIGTLYRHFPTREDLVEAVYEAELSALSDDAETLLARHPPEVALRRWMDRYAAFIAAKREMAQTLQALISAGTISRYRTRPRVVAAVAALLEAGTAAGTLRADVRAEDVTAAMVGVFLATASSDDADQAGRMLDLLVAGLRP